MAMSRPTSGAEQNGEVGSCLNCGTELAAKSWEYTDMVVPLNLRSNDRTLARHFDDKVRTHLQQAARGGWHPSNPVDWGSLWGSGMVKRSTQQRWYSLLGIGRSSFTWESVTIRLKRAAPHVCKDRTT